MAKISYPTSISIPGPWLLDLESLRNLDRLIDSCESRMLERRAELVESEVQERLIELEGKDVTAKAKKQLADELREKLGDGFRLKAHGRRLVIYMSGGRWASGQSFEELASLPNVGIEVPRGFDLRLEIADTELNVKLGSSTYDRELSVSVSCGDREFAGELFGRLDNWMSDIQPKKWLQMWLKSEIPSFILLVVALGCSVGLVLKMMAPRQGPSIVRQEATELARQGVNSTNEARAIQLILDIEVGYEPVPAPTVHEYPSVNSFVYWGLVLGVLIAFRLPPKGALGIWAGRRQLARQHTWIRFVSITVPGTFLTPVLLHWLGL